MMRGALGWFVAAGAASIGGGPPRRMGTVVEGAVVADEGIDGGLTVIVAPGDGAGKRGRRRRGARGRGHEGNRDGGDSSDG